MRAYRKEQPDLIYESENRWMKVYFDEHTDGSGKPELYMTLGHQKVGTDWGMFYAKINLNGFWVQISDYMKKRDAK